MNQNPLGDEVYRTEVLNQPGFNVVLGDVLAAPELARVFPNDELRAQFYRSQRPQTLLEQRIYTQAHRENPNEVVVMANGPMRFCEGWVFAVSLEFLRRYPGNPLNFEHFYGRINNVHVAAAVLRQLGQPRFLDLGAPQFGAEFWQNNLAHCPAAFRFLADPLRNNVDLARRAIRGQPDMLMFGGAAVRGSYELAMRAVRHNGLMLEYCSMPLRNDIDVVIQACQQNVHAAAFIGRTFLLSRDLMLELRERTAVTMADLAEGARQDAGILVSCFYSGLYQGDMLPDVVDAAVQLSLQQVFQPHNLDNRRNRFALFIELLTQNSPHRAFEHLLVDRIVQGGEHAWDAEHWAPL